MLFRSEALASVGASSSVQFLVLGFCMGSCTGFSVPVAKYFGAGKLDKMRDYIFNGAALAVLIAAILTTLCSLLCAPILHLLLSLIHISPLSACKTGMVFGGVLCKFAHADVLSSSLCFVFMHWFYANTFTSICKPQKSPPYRDFFIFSPFGGPFIHHNNYLWFALITDIAASSATTVRSL